MLTPIAYMETLGPISSQDSSFSFLSDLGRRISQVSDDVRESAFQFHRLSVLIQRFNGNSVAVQRNCTHTPTEDEFLLFRIYFSFQSLLLNRGSLRPSTESYKKFF